MAISVEFARMAIEKLSEENEALKAELKEEREESARLRSEVARLREENERLCTDLHDTETFDDSFKAARADHARGSALFFPLSARVVYLLIDLKVTRIVVQTLRTVQTVLR
jgi:hypothetical protein